MFLENIEGAKSKGLRFYCYNYFTKLRFDECVPKECKNQWELVGVHNGGRLNLGEIQA
jgi:hypothetical protein